MSTDNRKRTQLDRNIETLGYLRQSIFSLFRRAKKEHWTHKLLLTIRESDVFNHPKWSKLPSRYHSELMGYFNALTDVIWEDHLENHYELDGQTYRQSKETDKIFDGHWSKVKFIGMYWKDTDDLYCMHHQSED